LTPNHFGFDKTQNWDWNERATNTNWLATNIESLVNDIGGLHVHLPHPDSPGIVIKD